MAESFSQAFVAYLLCLASACITLALLPTVTRRLHLERRNFAAEPTRTGYGIAIWLPAVVALGWLGRKGQPGTAPAATALLIFGLVGLADDLWGDRSAGGFRGHLTRLYREGKVTTGIVKLAVGGGAALALGLWLAGDHAPPVLRALLEPPGPSSASIPPMSAVAPDTTSGAIGLLRVLASASVIALAANTFNLFDLRPLRTLKLFGSASALLLGITLAAHLPGFLLSSGQWPADLSDSFALPSVVLQLLGPAVMAATLYAPLEARRQVMLGDTGANALGALWGVAACVALPLFGQMLLGVVLLALNLYCERHSLTRLIQSHPFTDRLDRWGVRS